MSYNFLDEVKKQNKRITAKLMTKIENEHSDVRKIIKDFYYVKSKSQIIGVTGSPGSGKSTLVANLIRNYREMEKIVGVIVVDPTSPFTGGALLGDRIRMNEFALDKGVFIRSMATRGRLGGLAPKTSSLIQVLSVYGCDIIIVETVGTGQSEVDIIELADTTIVVVNPSTGDSIQSIKAGVFEIADIFVLNKADLEGKEKQLQSLNYIIELDQENSEKKWKPPIVETTAILDGEQSGIPRLIIEINKHNLFINHSSNSFKKKQIIKKELFEIIKTEFITRLKQEITEDTLTDYINQIFSQQNDPYSISEELLKRLNLKSNK